MILNRSFKYRIYLNSKQKNNFADLYFKCVTLFNLLLDEKETKINSNEDEGIFLKEFIKKYHDLEKGNFIAYMSVYRLVNQLIKKYKMGYIRTYPSKKSLVKYPKKIHFDIKTKFALDENNKHIMLDRIGTFKIKYHRPLPAYFYIRNVIIEEKSEGKYFINIGISEKKIDKNNEISNAIGLDYSSPHLFVTSENKNGDKYLVRDYLEDKIKNVRRKMHNCKFNSKNYLKLKYKHERLNQKVADKRLHLLNEAANSILKKYDLIGVETLSLSKIAQNHHLGKHTYQNAYDKFIKVLEYKALMQGKKVIKVSQFFPSSKVCSNCGQINENLSLDDRTYYCSCGFKIDRDLNATINIKDKAISMYASKNVTYDKNATKSLKNDF